MRFKVFLTFLAVQLALFAFWQKDHVLAQKTEVVSPVPVMEEAQNPIVQHEAAKPKLSLIRFSSKDTADNYWPLGNERKNQLMEVIAKLPSEHVSTLRNIVLDTDPQANRGLGGKSLIILRAVNMGEAESASVLVHEIGHIVDLGLLGSPDKKSPSGFRDGKEPVYEGDPSLGFYKISWENEKTRKTTAVNFDFVSGYGMSDPFEDFAECYIYYVLHNADFKAKAQTSDALYQKFVFMRDVVFKGKEFATGEYTPEDLKRRPWDVTVLSTDLQGFLNG